MKPNAFFSNVPGILLPGESYSDDELFRVLLNGMAPAGDYGGAVTFRGGLSLLANADLSSARFTILSPAVSIVATDSVASEFGPDAGLFTFSRSGATIIDLPVAFAVSGTAVNGLAYNAIPSALTIPAGSTSATLSIAPIPNSIAEGDRTAALLLTSSQAHNLGGNVSAAVTIHDKPADAWRFEKFGANANDPAAADTADWEGDGTRNLLEFALDLDPKVADPSAFPRPVIASGYPTFSFTPNAAATDLSFVVKASTDLAEWSAGDVEEISVANPEPPGLRTYRYRLPIEQSSRAFLRLEAERTDF